ncbi:hypothetical protein D0T87_04970 [Bacteroides sp. 51]|nr:hypothetical protein [Bacteroides sp. 51]
MDQQSCFAFLVSINEAFGYTHQQTLDSSMCVLLSMIKEHNFIINERNKQYSSDDEKKEADGEYVYVTDFETGERKKIKQVKSI